jgi:hypothetical protein
MRRGLLGVLLGALLFAVPGWAQEQRAAIEGVVKDAQGGVLPGVTVEARNLDGGVVTAVTDAAGVYRFPALAPGRYEITAQLTGFKTGKVENVILRLGDLKKIDFTLEIAAFGEEIQVTAESPLVNVKQAEVSKSIRKEDLELLPRGRDFTTVVTQVPGANQESKLGGISIDGASGSENRYIIDGIETTNMRNGTSGQDLITDFVDEVQVKSSGYTAEYGGATGGVINVLTRSGTNQFRGMGTVYFSGSALEGGREIAFGVAGGTYAGGRPTLRLSPVDSNVAEYIRYPEDDIKRWEPGFSIGGPLIQDRAWFFAAYQPQLQTIERTVTFQLDGQTRTKGQDRNTHFLSANQTAQLSDKLRTRVAYNMSRQVRKGLLPAIDGSSTPVANFEKKSTFPIWALSGNVDYVANSTLYFGARAGFYHANQVDSNVREEDRYVFITSNVGFVGLDGTPVPPEFQRVTNFATDIDFFRSDRDKLTRAYFQADATYYVNAAGQHTFKGGIQVDRLANDVLTGEAANLIRLYWGRTLGGQRGNYGYYRVRSNGVNPQRGFLTEGNVSTTNVGLFIQDAWTIGNRLTINLGLRTENETVPSFTTAEGLSSEAIKFEFSDKLAPRLGASYDMFGDGRWKVYGSWGIFYDIFKLELPRGSFGGDKWLEYYYTLDTYDWTTLGTSPNCPPACPGRLLRGPVDFRHPSNESIDPDIKPMKLQEAVAGVEHQLTANMAVGVRYVHKQIDRAVEDIGAIDANNNEIYVIGNPGFGLSSTFLPDGGTSPLPFPKAKRDYDAVEFTFNKLYSDNWALRLAYLWSRLEGNYTGLSQSDEGGRTSPNVGRMFDYPLMMFEQTGRPVDGPLPTDRPHQFKAQLIYTLPFGTSVGVNQYVSSGIPVTREAAVIPPNFFPVQYLGRGSDGRTDVFSQTDLYIQHEFKLPADKRLQVSFNVLNLFDQEAATSKFITENASGVGLSFSEPDFYAGRLDLRQLFTTQNVPRDPRFLKNSAFQYPIAARLGVRFIF